VVVVVVVAPAAVAVAVVVVLKLASFHRFLHNNFYCVLENIVYDQAHGFRPDDEQFISQHKVYI
jgi:hypothetical protein